MQKLFPGHQSTLEVWDEEGSTMLHVKLKQERQARKTAGEFALDVWRELFYGTGTRLVELVSQDQRRSQPLRVGFCYRLPNRGKEVDSVFYKQLKKVSRSQTLALMGD